MKKIFLIKSLLHKKHAKVKEIINDPKKLIKVLKWGFCGGAAFCFGVLIILAIIIIPTLPNINDIENLVAAQSSTIYDRNGELLYTIHGEENRKIVPLSEMSQSAINATLAMEDDQFYSHSGVDIPAVIKAVCAEVYICKRRGGSTITQQFVKNAFLTPERTYIRKLKEMILAFWLESKFSKDKILEMYLNRIPYGSNIYGIERASNTFFGKSANELTLAEGAMLAAIPQAPTRYSPYGNNKHASINLDADEIIKKKIKSEQDLIDINPSLKRKGLLGKTYTFTGADKKDKAISQEIYISGRIDFVLKRMQELKYITSDEKSKAIKEAEKKEFKAFIESIKAPHFVMYIKQTLEEKYGKDQVEKGGLKITTTLDVKMQDAAEKAVSKYAESNLKKYNASNASLVATDPRNGQILAMVGSADYWDDEIEGKVNVSLRSRLPGSSFKPIVYAAAFLHNYAPSTILYDVKTKFGAWYEPENYDGEFRGPVTMRQSLAHSLNIPAVKAGYLAGINNVIDLAKKMGIKLNQPNDWYGLSLALGAGEARLLDMVGAYGVFANGGYKMDSVAILKIEDRNGNILEKYQQPKEKKLILDPQVAYLVNDILSDVDARPTGYWRNTLTIPGQINAAKTGTSNKKKKDVNYPFDTWTIGYTKHVAAGVWAGNSDGAHLNSHASGLDVAGRIWKHFMVDATKGNPKEAFERPEKIKWVKISKKTGKLPSKHTPEDDIEAKIFASFSVPSEYESSYKIVKIDKVSKKLATEYTPEAATEEKAFFEHHAILKNKSNWENPVRKWAKENNEGAKVPTEYDDVHTADSSNTKPTIAIKSPSSLSTISPPYIGVWVDVTSKVGISHVEYYYDDQLMDTVKSSPFKGTIMLSKDAKNGSKHTIKAIVYDSLYNSRKSSVDVKIGADKTAPTIKFVYPKDKSILIKGSHVSAQVDASDADGDVKKVEFYMNDKLQHTDKITPYIWQFAVPSRLGTHNLRAIAYDHAGNKSASYIYFTSSDSDSSSSVNSPKIIKPYNNESFNEGDRVIINVALDSATQRNLKKLMLLTKKGKTQTQIASAEGHSDKGGSLNYTFIWDKAPAGTYELILKTVLQNGKIQFGERVSVVVR